MTATTTRVLDRLAGGLAPSALRTTPESWIDRLRDIAPFCAAGEPIALVSATTTDEVSHVLSVANAERVPVVCQGALTGAAGAANAVDGCILLSFEKMDRILEIDPVEQIAVVQPGTVNSTLAAAVAELGLFYPPDPGSWEMSTIGGNVATNAGGMCCVKYGVTADYIRALEFVLPGGRVMRTGRRTAKGVAGYDLTHLLTGSEGTLAAITEITVALLPEREESLTAVGMFPTVRAAAEAVAAVQATGRRPSMLELLDGPSIAIISDFRDVGLPDSGAVLLIRSDRGVRAAEDLGVFEECFLSSGADEVYTASDSQEADMLMETRRLLGPAIAAQGSPLADDVCVPVSALASLVDGVAEIGRRHDVRAICPGHAGDGNLHPAIFYDDDSVDRAFQAFGEIMDLGLSLGGTITGEHGVGLLKKSFLRRELTAEMLDLHRGVKAAFDPNGILNPGKVFD
ncbi:FAD-binding protein [Gordonia terrae]|uniref:FAD-binding protein n=2 Tax=Gordonia terrae TaxID=2055 RepID=A0AAD0K9Z3_9ACTN|nr:FAD-linked oxidase [Gordonia terrae]AWO82602.1 FAD-binding protein [Gordonia terrae]